MALHRGKEPLLDSLPVFGASMTGSPLNASQVILEGLRIGLKNGEVKFSLVISDKYTDVEWHES